MSKMEAKISNCAGSQLWPSMFALFLQKKLRKQAKVREVLFKIKKKNHATLNKDTNSIMPLLHVQTVRKLHVSHIMNKKMFSIPKKTLRERNERSQESE